MKRDTIRTFRTGAIALTIALSASGAMAQFYDVCSANPPEVSKDVHRVVILSPQVTVDFFKPGTPLHASEGSAEQVKAGFQSALSDKFEEQGFKPLLDPLLMPEWEAKNAIGISAVRHNFESVRELWPNCKLLLRSSFAGDLAKLVDAEEFDEIVLASADGEVRGKRTKGSNSLSFDVAIISRKSGQIVHYCSSSPDGDFLGDPYRSFTKPIQRCFQQWLKAKTH